jgi:membrane-bound lytic murein transglycosylase MltF
LDTVKEHYITSDALKADKMTKAPSRPEGGPPVASWYFKDTQVKGEAQRPFVEVIQAGRATAAEAMSENQIPRRYEEAVKAYFNQLEQSGPKP